MSAPPRAPMSRPAEPEKRARQGPSAARCPRCAQPLWLCLCPDIPVVENRTRIVIVRHVSEVPRSSNSGRAAALALRNCEIIDHGRPGAAVPREALAQPGTWLLFPEGEPRLTPPDPPPLRLVVLDATWHQARRMRQRLTGLRGLPVLRLPAAAGAAARLRAVPAPGHLSTIEAVAHALRLLEGEAPAAALETLFAQWVERSRRTGRSMP